MTSILSRLLGFACAAAIAGSGFAEAQSLNNKNLTMIVGFESGGGVDVVARMFGKHLVKNLPPGATLAVQNQPGAAGLNALNSLYNVAKKDGTAFAYEVWNPISVLTKLPGIKFEYPKLTMIGALRAGSYVMFARNDIVPGGVHKASDIRMADALIYAGQQPSLQLDMYGRLGLDLFMKGRYRYVSGYRGANEIRLAMERDEANVTVHALQGYLTAIEPRYVKEGLFTPLWHFPRREPNGEWFSDPKLKTPSFVSAYRDAFNKEPDGPEWELLKLVSDLYSNVTHFIWAPPGVDPSIADQLRKAFDATASDPALQMEQESIFGLRYEPVPIKEAQRIVNGLDHVDPQIVGYLGNYMK